MNIKKKIEKMYFFHVFFYYLIIFIFLLEIFTYPGIWLAKTGFSLNIFLSLGIFFFLIIKISNFKIKISKPNKYIFFFSLPFFFICPIADQIFFPNYIFSQWKINYHGINYLVFFSFFIALIENKIKKAIIIVRNIIKKNRSTVRKWLVIINSKKSIIKLLEIIWKNYIKLWIKKNCLIIIFFCVFLLIMLLIPPTADMIITENTFNRHSFRYVFINQTIKQLTIGGRAFIGFVFELIAHQFPFGLDILYSFNIIIIMFITGILFKFQKKIHYSLFFLLTLIVSNGIFISVYLYANVAYITPLILILLFLLLLKKNKYFLKKQISIPLCLISFFIGNSMEHIGASFLTVMLLWLLVDYIKNKKINKSIIFATITASAGFFYTILGIFTLKSKELIGIEMIDKIEIFKMTINNFNLLLKIIIEHNNNIFLIGNLIIIISLFKNIKSIKKYKLECNLIIYYFLISVFLFLINFFPNDYFSTGLFATIFWAMYLCSLIIPVLMIKISELFFLYLIAFFSVPPIILSKYLADRTLSIVIFVFIIITTTIFSRINWKKKEYNFIFFIIILVLIIKTFVLFQQYVPIYLVQKKREIILKEIILKQKKEQWNYKDFLILPKFPEKNLWGAPNYLENNFYYPILLDNYNLNINTKIKYE